MAFVDPDSVQNTVTPKGFIDPDDVKPTLWDQMKQRASNFYGPIGQGFMGEIERQRNEVARQMQPGFKETPQDIQQSIGNIKSMIGSVAGGAAAGTPNYTVPGYAPTGLKDWFLERARQMYQSGAKFLPSLGQEELKRRVMFGLEKGIIPNASGVEKVNDTIDALIQERKAVLGPAAEQGAWISRDEILNRLDNMLSGVGKTSEEPLKDLEVINQAKESFMAKPEQIPLLDAEATKETIYKKLKDSAYGQFTTMGKETKKALARSIKEIINERYPEVKGINEEMSQYIKFKESLDRAFNRIDNRDLIGLAPSVMGATNKPLALAKAILDHPKIKTRVAVELFKLINSGPAAQQLMRQSGVQVEKFLDPDVRAAVKRIKEKNQNLPTSINEESYAGSQ